MTILPKVLLTVPHAAKDVNDVNALPVARALSSLLYSLNIDTECLANLEDRCYVDGNRRESRNTKFRRDIVKRVRSGVDLLVDIHSFPITSVRFVSLDIVLLHTPGVQSKKFYRLYAALLNKAAVSIDTNVQIAIMYSERVNDICIEAVENGQPKDSLMLVEHSEIGNAKVYALLHSIAIDELFRRWK